LNERKENMQTKKNRKIISGLAVVCVMLLCVFGFNLTGIYAEANSSDEPLLTGEPSMTFESFNVSYSNSVYILYAVSNEGFDRKEYPIKMLFWTQTQDEYTLENAEYYTENKGKANVNGKSCLVFYSDGLAAKEMTTDVYSRACVEIDGKTYYSEVIKFSVLEYVLSMQEKGNLPSNLKKLYTQLLEYGAAAQNNFGHNTHRPANGKYYNITVNGGTLPDGFTSGRYQNKDKVVITANEPEEGMRFSHWIDERGIIVSYRKSFEITVGTQSKAYTAIYRDVSNVATQLKLTAEIPYNGTIEDVELPTAVSFDINGETVTLEVTWNTEGFTTGTIGKQNIYADLNDTAAYGKYGIEPGSILLEVTTLPFAYEIDTDSGEYILTGYYGSDASVTIPKTYKNTLITKIASRAFNASETLRSLTIPETVKVIENGAIFYCDAIERITVPFIGESASSGNSWFGWIFGAASYDIQNGLLPLALEKVTLAEGATVIPNYAFYHCSQIESFDLPEGITGLGSRAFAGCTQLTEFTLPSTLTSFSNSFDGCTNIKRINVANVDMLFSINCNWGSPFAEGADLYCNGRLVTEITVPSGTTNINCIIEKCTSIKKINVPASVVSISSSAFYGMTALEEVVFEDPGRITSLGSYAFSHCTSLKSIDLSGFTELREIDGTFYECTSLTEVKLPAGLTSIGSSTFQQSAIYEIDIPTGVQKIGGSCFSYCPNLTRVNIPEGVIEIGTYAFSNCDSLRYVNMPSALTTIGNYAFDDCQKLTVIEIPERVYSIGDAAFRYCTNLSCVIIKSERLASIGNNAFYSCSKLYEIYNLSDINITAGSDDNGCIGKYAKVIHTSLDEEMRVSVDEDGFILYTADAEVILLGYVGDESEIAIPSIGGNKPYKINASAFANNPKLTSVIIPDCVTEIGNSAFFSCYRLVEIINHSSLSLSPGSSDYGSVAYYALEVHTGESRIDNVNGYLFYTLDGTNYLVGYVGSDTELILPESYKGESYVINKYAFRGKDDITSVIISGSVTSIGERAFQNCGNLKSAVIGGSVTSIDNMAFDSCYNLTSIIINAPVTSIDSYVFQNCSKLTEISLPSSLTTIGTGAFSGCPEACFTVYKNGKYLGNNENPYLVLVDVTDQKLESYEIHQDTKIICGYAFYNCESLTEIVIPDSVVFIGENAFEYCKMLSSVTIGESVAYIAGSAFHYCDNLTSVSFRNPEGWMRTGNSSNFTGGSKVSAEEIQDSEIMSEYLSYHYYYSWYRT